MRSFRELAAALLLACPLLALALYLTARSPAAALQVSAVAATLVHILTCLIPSGAVAPTPPHSRPPARLLVIIQIHRGAR
jgi:hypothetical protein